MTRPLPTCCPTERENLGSRTAVELERGVTCIEAGIVRLSTAFWICDWTSVPASIVVAVFVTALVDADEVVFGTWDSFEVVAEVDVDTSAFGVTITAT
jgi:hypothetical protein